MGKRRPRVFFGWLIVAVAGIVSGLGLGFYICGKGIFFAGLGLYSNDNNYLTNKPFNHLTNSVIKGDWIKMQRPLQDIRIVDRLPRVGRGNERNCWKDQIHQVGIND